MRARGKERVKLVWKEEPEKKKSENMEMNFQEKKKGREILFRAVHACVSR